MPISLDEVDRIAKLARLSFNDDEKQKFTQELTQILDYVGQISALTDQVDSDESLDPDSVNLMRDDVALETTSPDELIKLAPQSQDGFYKVKSVF
jgi:aspartyl-tRNA(Asn)/glutamyl-tRNA(Gln) amidotransferase subunit C